MTTSTHGFDLNPCPIGIRFDEAVNCAIESKLLAMFEEQIAAEFHTPLPTPGP